jgi:hypothetical protein
MEEVGDKVKLGRNTSHETTNTLGENGPQNPVYLNTGTKTHGNLSKKSRNKMAIV